MELLIIGTADEVIESLRNIQAVVESRNATGWEILHPSEEWEFIVDPVAGEVCPLCTGYSGMIFSGDMIAVVFPYYEYLGGLLILPRTHMPDLSEFMNEPCHCELRWMNMLESIEGRLHEEKLLVVVV